MKFSLPIIIVGGIFALLLLLERLFPLRPSTRSLFRRLVVNLAISAVAFMGMMKWKWGVLPVVIGSGLVGLVLQMFLPGQ